MSRDRQTGVMSCVMSSVVLFVVLLFSGGLALFPVGLNSDFVRQICGATSRSYWPAECTLGWTGILAVVSDGLAVFCPFLSRHLYAEMTHS